MDSDGDDDMAAMQQAMGFSAFGAPPSKKRRYNSHADFTGPDFVPEGSNALPLGNAPPHAKARPELAVTGPSSADDGDALDGKATATEGQNEASLSQATTLPQIPGLPARPVNALPDAAPRFDNGNGAGRPRHGQTFNERWYEGYYDPSSNENPWERLEATAGLQTKGPWLPRGHSTSAAQT